MKRFVAVLGAVLALPAFAEVMPVFYEEEIVEVEAPEVAEDVVADEKNQSVVPAMQPSRVNPRSGNVAQRGSGRATANTRATRTTTGAGVRARTVAQPVATESRGVAKTRAASVRPSRAASGKSTNQIATTRRAMQADNHKGVQARASIVTSDTVNKPLYNGRVGTRVSSVRARIPSVTGLVSGGTATSATTAADAVAEMDELSQMTDYCKAQYTSCMDNFCNVLDDNQGRCSCSKNIKNYLSVENALKEATEELQDVAQQIQYIGLSADDIETLFTQTEAELKMTEVGEDSTTLATDLDNIKKLLLEPKEIKASAVLDSSSSDVMGLLDINTIFTGNTNVGANWLFNFGTDTNAEAASINNQRGEALYNIAKKRCTAAVLDTCAGQGVNTAVVSNAYDMEIDKQCVAYERSLKDANDAMNNTVRNAKNVLQRARLLVRQQKNSYDLRGCVSALDACMQDEFVCGADYENCLDPSGKYIVNGAIVVGSTPGQWIDASTGTLEPGYTYDTNTLHATWNYTDSNATGVQNAWLPTVNKTGGDTYVPTLAKYIDATIAPKGAYPEKPGDTMSSYLQYRIGYHNNADGRNYGMCMSVLNKCQDVTYTGVDGAYNPDNPVVREYLQRTLTQIKVRQDEIMASYAENCIPEVSSCLSQNNYSVSANIAINACRQQIVTCMSINGDAAANPTPDSINKWVKSIQGAQ